MRADDDMISIAIIIVILIIISMLIMNVRRKMNIMLTKRLEPPICERVLQILDMTIPKPGF